MPCCVPTLLTAVLLVLVGRGVAYPMFSGLNVWPKPREHSWLGEGRGPLRLEPPARDLRVGRQLGCQLRYQLRYQLKYQLIYQLRCRLGRTAASSAAHGGGAQTPSTYAPATPGSTSQTPACSHLGRRGPLLAHPTGTTTVIRFLYLF